MEREKEITVETRIGQQRISTDKIIHFPRGLVGFESMHEFALLQIQEDSPFLVLQSVDEPRLGLLVTNPYAFLKEYEIRIGDAEQAILKVADPQDLTVLVTVSIPAGHPDKTTLNLSGPVIFNHSARIGMQVPQVDGRGPSHVRVNLTAKREEPCREEGV